MQRLWRCVQAIGALEGRPGEGDCVILIGPGKKGSEKKEIPVLVTVEYTAVLFWSSPL